MHGTRRIVLREPRPTGEAGAFGQETFRPPVDHVVYALRDTMKGGGAEGLIGREVIGVDVSRTYRFPADALPSKREVDGKVEPIIVDETWTLIDEQGVEIKIDAVGEAQGGPLRRWLRVVCERKDPEGVAA